MPTYNRAALIGETIHSILAQEFRDWELLVVDDGSTDDTEKVVKSVHDDRIIYCPYSRIGYGIGLRSIAIEKAKGELIAFADSDDLWHPRKLLLQVELLTERPESMFCLTGGYNFRKGKQDREVFYRDKKGCYTGSLLGPMLRSEVALFPQTILFRRDCIPVLHESVSNKPGADIQFLIGLAAQFTGSVIYDALLFRRLHEGNYSSVEWRNGYQEGIDIVRELLQKNKVEKKQAYEFLFRIYIHYGEKCRRYRLRKESIMKFFKAWQYRPLSIIPLKKMGKALLPASE